MYNKELKLQYIDDNEYLNLQLRTIMLQAFESTEPLEDSLQKDVSNFTVKEIIAYYKTLCTASLERLMVLNSQLSRYTNYCLNNYSVQDNQNHYLEIDVDILKTCLNVGKIEASIVTREELLADIESLPNPSERFLVLAIYEGILGKQYSELANLNIRQFHDGIVDLGTRQLTVSNELVKLAEESTDEYFYYCYVADGSFKQKNYLYSDDNIIKSLYNAKHTDLKNKRKVIYNRLIRIKSFLGKEAYTAAGLIESGRIGMIREYMKKDNINVNVALKRYDSEINQRYGKIYSVSRYLLKYKSFFED